MARSTSCFCNNLRLFVIISCIIFTLHCESSTAAGNPSGDISESVDEYLSFLASATHYTPMEGAGSHGSIGIGFGAGISVHPTPAAGTVYHDQWRDPSKPSARESRSSDSVAMPRVFVHKGLPLPVDLGIGLAKATDNRATIGSAYAQWTLYEAFAMPAFALRTTYSRMMGLEATEFSSLSGEAVASIGFLRYLTAYGTYGVNHLAATIRTTGASATSLHLSDDNSEDFHRDFAQTAYALGLQIQALPPFFSVSIENKTDGPVKSWFLKACVGI